MMKRVIVGVLIVSMMLLTSARTPAQAGAISRRLPLVIDANRRRIGAYFVGVTSPKQLALRRINRKIVGLPLDSPKQGFSSPVLSLLYESADCSTTAYMKQPSSAASFIQLARVHDGTAYYPDPAMPIEQRTFQSQADSVCADGTGTPLPSGFCCIVFPQPESLSAGVVVTFDVSPFVPPFSVK